MTDLDPNIWKNETLGAVGAGPFLPEIDKQAAENVNAKKEGREPDTVEYVHRYPKMMPSGTIPSVQEEFRFISPDATDEELIGEPSEEDYINKILSEPDND